MAMTRDEFRWDPIGKRDRWRVRTCRQSIQNLPRFTIAFRAEIDVAEGVDQNIDSLRSRGWRPAFEFAFHLGLGDPLTLPLEHFLQQLVDDGIVEQSADFAKLRDRTKRDYERQIAKIEVQFGEMPIAALNVRG